MDLSIYNNIRFEYSVGANVILFSLIDTSEDKSVLVSSNISKVLIEYSYDGNTYTYEKELSFHINSIIMVIDDLPSETNIIFTPYIILLKDNGSIKYKIKITDPISETTLPYGNIEYNIINDELANQSNLQNLETKISEVIGYINRLGSYVDLNYQDTYIQCARTIPVMYNSSIQTASARYYKVAYRDNDDLSTYGLVQSSGGTYTDNDVLFHELRHRYGIYYPGYSHLTRETNEETGLSENCSYIEDKFSILHNALRFETGRNDAKVWVFVAHSNILEGDYTNDGVMNYLAANYLKALIWYTCHDPEDLDTSKIRINKPISLSLIEDNSNTEEIEPEIIPVGPGENEDPEPEEPQYIEEDIGYNKVQLNPKKRQKTLHLNNYQYLCKYYKNNIDFKDNVINNFVILRNFEIFNDIIYDKDIFFIDKSIYNKIKNSETTDQIVFPFTNNSQILFSNSFSLFNIYGFYNMKDICYDIYDKNDHIANIKCDKIRIYNPIIKKDMNYIIYVDNYINGVHFHYFCSTNEYLKKYCDNETIIGNDRYIEYIEIKIPCLDKLFNSKYYIIDEYNNIVNNSYNTINQFVADYNNNGMKKSENNKLYFENIISPYLIKDKSKVYITNKSFNYNINYINTSFNITLCPYDNILDNIYMRNDVSSNTIFMNNDFYIRLHSEMGFDNNGISILNTFEFPGKVVKEDNYYDIDIHGEITKDNQYKDQYINQVTEYYNTYYIYDNLEYLKDQEEFRDEINIENIRTTGYLIQIANDLQFNEIVYESIINTDEQNDNFIYDFSFSLDNIVNSWNQLNEILVIRTKFIDKRLNISITGNNVVLTKEWFKYLINEINTNNIKFNKQNNLIEEKFMNISNGFNFIDKINCIIKEDSNVSSIGSNSQNNSPQIIYKPIFYKVQDLQNLKIRQNVIQKIGINLSDYMTKIKLFILNIEGKNIKESSRNDIYVIFEINANDLIETNGIYNILDENFEYLSSGNYTLY